MTFWHYHWALIRARSLELSPVERFAFAHMAQLANPAGLVAYSITSMADDLGVHRGTFSEAVRELWKRGALYAAGKSSRGRMATVYRLVDELEARQAVEADREVRRQPSPPTTVAQAQPSPITTVDDQPSPTTTVEPSPTTTVENKPSPGDATYKPRLRSAAATVVRGDGSRPQPSSVTTQPSSQATHYKEQSLNHESEPAPQWWEANPAVLRSAAVKITTSPGAGMTDRMGADRWKDWRSRQAKH